MGSEEGGALVTVTGVGFGNKQLTPQVPPQRAVWAIGGTGLGIHRSHMTAFFRDFLGHV